MDVTITNLSADPVFIPGPNVDLDAAGGTNAARVWPDVTIADLDGNTRLKALVVAGTVSVNVTQDAEDVAKALTGSMKLDGLASYPVASLPVGFPARIAFATDGRAGAEGVGVGTGTMVVFSNAAWRRVEDLAVVAA